MPLRRSFQAELEAAPDAGHRLQADRPPERAGARLVDVRAPRTGAGRGRPAGATRRPGRRASGRRPGGGAPRRPRCPRPRPSGPGPAARPGRAARAAGCRASRCRAARAARRPRRRPPGRARRRRAPARPGRSSSAAARTTSSCTQASPKPAAREQGRDVRPGVGHAVGRRPEPAAEREHAAHVQARRRATLSCTSASPAPGALGRANSQAISPTPRRLSETRASSA